MQARKTNPGRVPSQMVCRFDIVCRLERTFRKEPTKSGRGARILNKGRSAASGIVPFVQQKHAEAALGGLGSAERSWLNAPWWFVYSEMMRSCGPEFGFFGSVKWQGAGRRRVLLVNCESLSKHITKTWTKPHSLAALTAYNSEVLLCFDYISFSISQPVAFSCVAVSASNTTDRCKGRLEDVCLNISN